MPPRAVNVMGRGEPSQCSTDVAPPESAGDAAVVSAACPGAPIACGCASRDARDVCRRECMRLEANKVAAGRMLRLFENPVLALREYNRFVRDLNLSINLHNSVCARYPVLPMTPPGQGSGSS